MSADIGAAASKTEDLQKELERIAAIARGDIPGIVSVQYTEEAIRALESNKTKAEQTARKKTRIQGPCQWQLTRRRRCAMRNMPAGGESSCESLR